MTRPFRFLAPMPPLTQPARAWRDGVRRIEDLGFSTVSVSDHFTGDATLEPGIAMMAAAEATERLRVLALVFDNDYRHPVMLHKTAAMIDVLSDGRLELGMGAGWLATDYEAAGMPYDPPGVRVSRLEESVQVVKGLFGEAPVTFEGEHYRITGLVGQPPPVQRPHPPLLIGGGGRRVLGLAAREADIVGINANLRAGSVTREAALDMAAERVAQKVDLVHKAAADAGRTADDFELQISTFLLRVTDSAAEVQETANGIAAMFGADPALVHESPAVLIGSFEQVVEKLEERRERYGFSYVGLGNDLDAAAPIVARLAGS